MEQCFSMKVASTTFRTLSAISGIFLLIALQPLYSSPPSADRDYLFPDESSGGFISARAKTQSEGSGKQKQSAVSYQAFDGTSHMLEPHAGQYVTVLLPAGGGAANPLTPDHIEELVDRLDILYATYQDLMQDQPRGSGLLTVAFVPETCGVACGYIGHKGIEIEQNADTYSRIALDLENGELDSIMTHEMAHNFDLYWNYLHYLPDHGHAWTDMFEYFAPFRFARQRSNQQQPDDLYHSPSNSVWKAWLEDDSTTWEKCVRDQLCHAGGFTENKLWAMLYYRIEALHGASAVLRSFDYMKAYAASSLPPETTQQKEDLRLMSLAVGADTNISCYLDALKWTVSTTLRSELQARFGDGGALCADNDQDGYSVVTGDCDDKNAGRNPGQLEIQGNGEDEDCDEIADEYHLLEPTGTDLPGYSTALAVQQLPLEINASVSDLSDRDAVRFALPSNGRVEVNLCGTGGFSGWVVALQDNGQFLNSGFWYEFLDVTGCSKKAFDFGSQSSGQLEISANRSPGRYSLRVSAATDMPPDRSSLLQVSPRTNNGMNVVVSDPDGSIAGIGANEIEIWISGRALRLKAPFSGQATFSLNASSAPGLTSGNRYQARLRPLKNGRPLEGFSAGHLFRYDLARETPVGLDGGYSGSWFDPSHDGEGFVVEVHDDGQALVYWFTFTPDGAQRWMLGLGEVNGNSLVVSELLNPHGGRFGSDFNPEDVTFADTGSLRITFLDCSSAIVNYRVDGIGDHQELVRLNSVHGLPCGGSAPALNTVLNGSWYDPSHSGEGFVIQQLSDEEALVYWFSYTGSGEPAWLFNTASVAGGAVSVKQLLQPSGGRFGRSFKPASVTTRTWGHLEMQLDCSGGIASYDSELAGFSSGSQKLIPLTRLQNSACEH